MSFHAAIFAMMLATAGPNNLWCCPIDGFGEYGVTVGDLGASEDEASESDWPPPTQICHIAQVVSKFELHTSNGILLGVYDTEQAAWSTSVYGFYCPVLGTDEP